ncbi:MAG: transcription elongation factor GreA [Actinobacteria bacterium]|nr:transcription elongation factor GreA [Actinomycetota bacterium]MCA1721713.1 transcription elongation factor GreA [Actinomycetota bacterium]
MSTPHQTWLTQEAYDRLQAELDHLSGPGRVEIAAKIESAREEGDLKENGGYHAAREEQGKMDARRRQLAELMRDAASGPPPATSGTIDQGALVSVDYGDGEVERFLFGSRENANREGGKIALGEDILDVYSPESPIGQALAGHAAGDVVTFGPRSIKVTVVAVEPFPA